MNKGIKLVGLLFWVGLSTVNAAVIEYNTNFIVNNNIFYSVSTAEGITSALPASGFHRYNKETQSLRVQGFDTNLGLLTDVSISITSTWNWGLSIAAIDNIPEVDGYIYNSRFGFSFSYLDYNTAGIRSSFYNELFIQSVDGNIRNDNSQGLFALRSETLPNVSCSSRVIEPDNVSSVSCENSISRNYTFSQNFDLSGFSPEIFEINNSNDEWIDFILSNKVYLRDFYCSSDVSSTGVQDLGDSCSATGDSNWQGEVKISYTYEKVPEPSIIALLGLGLFGLRLMSKIN